VLAAIFLLSFVVVAVVANLVFDRL